MMPVRVLCPGKLVSCLLLYPLRVLDFFLAGYTVSRAILSDAIALTRGDRFFTADCTPFNLTAWGFADSQRDWPSHPLWPAWRVYREQHIFMVPVPDARVRVDEVVP
jgi:hypothetical protein